MNIYHLSWKKYSFDDFNPDEFNKDNEIGIYQIYGNHPVYGQNTLIYIGQTKKSFGSRLTFQSHKDFSFNHISAFTNVYIGKFLKRDEIKTRKNIENVIDDVEKILINSHYPAFNSSEIKNMIKHNDKNEFIVINWGDYGKLLPEVSTLKFSDKYWDTEKYSEDEI